MKSYLALAWKELKAQKITAILILVAVIMSTIMTTVIGQSIGILQSILNIINTVYSNIHTRVGEIGMQRAIGMSAASLYKTFLWEGAYYGIIASVIGAVFGYVCCIFVGAAQTDALQLVAVPVMAIVEAAIISIVACLLATAIPLRSIARMSIVDSIETVE